MFVSESQTTKVTRSSIKCVKRKPEEDPSLKPDRPEKIQKSAEAQNLRTEGFQLRDQEMKR